jgi:hypothetical protein
VPPDGIRWYCLGGEKLELRYTTRELFYRIKNSFLVVVVVVVPPDSCLTTLWFFSVVYRGCPRTAVRWY